MDCEKFEPLLLDELYDELDEVTSAAVKRHASGCAHCGPILDGMRSTRRQAVLPMLELPSGLEDRILASVREAQKVVPIQSRGARALSWAGSWAMRPQTAMAAVFLLMIGTSAFVIRSRHSSERAAAVSVTEQGMPAGQSAAADDHESLDSKAAAAAHGPNAPVPTTAPPVAAASPVASASGALALGDPATGLFGGNAAGPMDGLTGGKGRGSKADEAFGSALSASLDDQKDKSSTKEEAQAPAEKKTADRGALQRDMSNAGVPGGTPNADYAPRAQTIAPPTSKSQLGSDQQDGFSAGMAAYRTRNFAEATRQFDGAARSGDQNAALWAAKSVKDGNGGCGVAIPRFDAVAQKSSGTWVGNEAKLEAARCQIATGQLAAAREKLAALSKVASHAAPAQQALNELNQVASRREAERSKKGVAGGGGVAARPAAAAPRRAPSKPAAKPAATAADVDKANGF